MDTVLPFTCGSIHSAFIGPEGFGVGAGVGAGPGVGSGVGVGDGAGVDVGLVHAETINISDSNTIPIAIFLDINCILLLALFKQSLFLVNSSSFAFVNFSFYSAILHRLQPPQPQQPETLRLVEVLL